MLAAENIQQTYFKIYILNEHKYFVHMIIKPHFPFTGKIAHCNVIATKVQKNMVLKEIKMSPFARN